MKESDSNKHFGFSFFICHFNYFIEQSSVEYLETKARNDGRLLLSSCSETHLSIYTLFLKSKLLVSFIFILIWKKKIIQLILANSDQNNGSIRGDL